MKLSLKRLNFNLVTSSLIVLSLGWPIATWTGFKFQYFYFLLTTVFIFLLNFQKKAVPFVLPYCFVFIFVFIYHTVLTGITLPFLISIATYFAIPLVYSRNLITSEDFVKILNGLSVVTLFNLLGVVLQIFQIGTDTTILKTDYAVTGNEFHPRYTGFSGGSLALGILSCITLFSGLYHVLIPKTKTTFNWIVIIASICCLIFSFARRFYIFGAVGCLVLLFIWIRHKKVTLNVYLCILMGLSVIAITFIVVLTKSEIITERLASILNFSTDRANRERFHRWEFAFDLFIKNFSLGLSPGITGTAGRGNVNNDTVFSTESYYLKILIETGFFSSFVYFMFLVFMIKKCVIRLWNPALTLPITIALFYIIESFISTSLESPFSSVLFWISLALVYHTPPNLKLKHD